MIYEEFLWGNIEEIHKRFKRQYDYTNNLIYVFTQYQNLLYYFSKEVNKIVDNHLQLYEEKVTKKTGANAPVFHYDCIIIQQSRNDNSVGYVPITVPLRTGGAGEIFQRPARIRICILTLRSLQ